MLGWLELLLNYCVNLLAGFALDVMVNTTKPLDCFSKASRQYDRR